MHRTANPATPVRLRARPPAAVPALQGIGLLRHIFLAFIACLGLAAPAAALERSSTIIRLEDRVAYEVARDAAELQALVNRSLPESARGDAWDKLVLGIQYMTLASWHRPSFRGFEPPPMVEAPDMSESESAEAASPMRPQAGAQIEEPQHARQAPIDYAQQAINWLKAAASEGLAAAPGVGRSGGLLYRRAGSLATNALGEIYGFGIEPGLQSKGIAPDYLKAYVWFSLAAAENEAGAEANLQDVSVHLSRAERSEAEKQIAALKPQLGN